MNEYETKILIDLVNAEIDKEVKICVNKITEYESYDFTYLGTLYNILGYLKE